MSDKESTATGEDEDSEDQTFIGQLQAAHDRFQHDTELGEVVLQGKIGFHTFYNNEEAAEHLTTGIDTTLHQAFDIVTEEIHIDDEIVRDEWGEVTPETVALEVARQIDEYRSWGFAEAMADAVQQLLEARDRESLDTDGDRA